MEVKKRVLITGAGNGLGRQLALCFAKKGSKLILWDIDEDALKKTASECKQFGCEEIVLVYQDQSSKYSDKICNQYWSNLEVKTARVDLALREQIYVAAEKVNYEYGGIDILVSNAGLLNGGYFMELDDEKLDRIVDVNYKAHFWIVKSFFGGMLERNSGHIVSICSMASFAAAPRLVDYASTKHALLGFMEGLQNEVKDLGKNGIKITTVCPYWINTNLIQHFGYSFAVFFKQIVKKSEMMSEEYVAARIMTAVCMNRNQIVLPGKMNLFVRFRWFVEVSKFIDFYFVAYSGLCKGVVMSIAANRSLRVRQLG
ncbi:unnamed protein product [Toxocara canis]|uniref:Epidermal retinol dehydrogenase 2 n=1 Tax=Toxocara canis TaxID=6265 RepID=A0A183UTY1_TOXCA|nr:unnamed protein product [Toxocara canis]